MLNGAFNMIFEANDIIVCRGILTEYSPEEEIHYAYESGGKEAGFLMVRHGAVILIVTAFYILGKRFIGDLLALP